MCVLLAMYTSDVKFFECEIEDGKGDKIGIACTYSIVI